MMCWESSENAREEHSVETCEAHGSQEWMDDVIAESRDCKKRGNLADPMMMNRLHAIFDAQGSLNG
jgi:hypothetical protein